MAALVEIVLPIFGIVTFGYLATFTRAFDATAAKGLTAFVFWFAIPLMLFKSMAGAKLPDASAATYLLSYYGATAAVMIAGLVLGGPGPFDRRVILGMGSGYSNTVLLGIPLVLTAVGPEAALPLFMLIAFHGMIFFTAVTVLIEQSRGDGARITQVPKQMLQGLIANPILIAMATGLAFAFLHWTLPRPLDQMVELIGKAAAPCALFAMGASLRAYRIGGALRPAAIIVALKLVAHPLLVAALVYLVFDLPPAWSATAVICAALPTGINSYLFAVRYQTAEAESATAILLSSVLSLPIVTLVLWWLRAG